MLFLIFVFIVGSMSKMMEIVNNLQYFPKTYYLKCLKNYLIHQKSLWHCPLKHLKCCLNTSKVDSHTMLLSGPSIYVTFSILLSVCLVPYEISGTMHHLIIIFGTQVKQWWHLLVYFFSFFFLILIFGVLGG